MTVIAASIAVVGILFVSPVFYIYYKMEIKRSKKLWDALEDSTVFLSHTCSNCGHTFKVKYKKQEGQTEIPRLSAICPKCKAKGIIISSDTE